MPSYGLQFPIRVPDDVLVELGEFTGNFWSNSLAAGGAVPRNKLPEIREEPKKNATRRWRRWRRFDSQAALADSARPQ